MFIVLSAIIGGFFPQQITNAERFIFLTPAKQSQDHRYVYCLSRDFFFKKKKKNGDVRSTNFTLNSITCILGLQERTYNEDNLIIISPDETR